MESYKIFKKADELDFISVIDRDGHGVSQVAESYLEACKTNSLMKDEYYELHRLSIAQETYIAFNFNAYIVKIKKI